MDIVSAIAGWESFPALVLWLGGSALLMFYRAPMLRLVSGEFTLLVLVLAGLALWSAAHRPLETGATKPSATVLTSPVAVVPWGLLVLGGLLTPVLVTVANPDSNHRQVDSNSSKTSASLFETATETAQGSHPAGALGCMLYSLSGGWLTVQATDSAQLFVGFSLGLLPLVVIPTLPEYALRRGRESAVLLLLAFLLAVGMLGVGLCLLQVTTRVAVAPSAPARPEPLLFVALVILLFAFALPMAAAPLHFWVTEAFAGVNAGGAALLGVLPALIGFIGLMRLAELPLIDGPQRDLLVRPTTLSLWVMATSTLLLGSLLAVGSVRLHQTFAFLTMAQIGQGLAGLTLATQAGTGPHPALSFGISAAVLQWTLLPLCVTGLWGTIAVLGTRGHQLLDLEDLKNCSHDIPLACALLVFLAALMGLPPTLGFWCRVNFLFAAFTNVQATRLTWTLAFASVTAMAIQTTVFVRVWGMMFFEPTREPGDSATFSLPRWLIIGLALVFLILGFWPTPLARSLEWSGNL